MAPKKRPAKLRPDVAETAFRVMAMAAGIADHVWTVEEILGLMDPNRLLTSR